MYIIKILLPFETVIDIDIGLWNIIKYQYNNHAFFLERLINTSEANQKYFMMVRDNRNPLLTLLTEPSEELADDFYSQFMEQEYDNILELSPNTDICKMLDSMKRDKSSIIRATILCKDEKQKHIIETRNIQHDSIIISDYNRVSLKDYGTIFVKDIKDLDKYRIVEGKTIYVANYGFNILMDPDKVNPLIPIEVLEKYGNTNEFYIYSVYTLDPRKMPKG